MLSGTFGLCYWYFSPQPKYFQVFAHEAKLLPHLTSQFKIISARCWAQECSSQSFYNSKNFKAIWLQVRRRLYVSLYNKIKSRKVNPSCINRSEKPKVYISANTYILNWKNVHSISSIIHKKFTICSLIHISDIKIRDTNIIMVLTFIVYKTMYIIKMYRAT